MNDIKQIISAANPNRVTESAPQTKQSFLVSEATPGGAPETSSFYSVTFEGGLGLQDVGDAQKFVKELQALMKKHLTMGFDYDLDITQQELDVDGEPIGTPKKISGF